MLTNAASSNGRGPRTAAWLQDYFNEIGEQDVKAYVLKGGVKGWARAYSGELMDWYDKEVWEAPRD
jgi:arsenical-resistance protein 2